MAAQPHGRTMRGLLTRLHHRRSTSKRGQALVEMALIVPFLLAFAGGATDMARAW
ncbi:MAG: pilus assembly protein, partial [Chloroflexi bacterium]